MDGTNIAEIVIAFAALVVSVAALVVSIIVKAQNKRSNKIADKASESILKNLINPNRGYYKNIKIDKLIPNYKSNIGDQGAIYSLREINNIDTKDNVNLALYSENHVHRNMSFLNIKKFNNLVIEIADYLNQIISGEKKDKYNKKERKLVDYKIDAISEEIRILRDKLEMIPVAIFKYPTIKDPTSDDAEDKNTSFLSFFASWVLPKISAKDFGEVSSKFFENLRAVFYNQVDLKQGNIDHEEALLNTIKQIFNFHMEFEIQWKESDLSINIYEKMNEMESNKGVNDTKSYHDIQYKKEIYETSLANINNKKSNLFMKSTNYFKLDTYYRSIATYTINTFIMGTLYVKVNDESKKTENSSSLQLIKTELEKLNGNDAGLVERLKLKDLIYVPESNKRKLYGYPEFYSQFLKGHSNDIIILGTSDNEALGMKDKHVKAKTIKKITKK